MVAEPGKVSAPRTPHHPKPCYMLAYFLVMIGGCVECSDDILDKEETKVDIPFTDMVDLQDFMKDDRLSRDWCPRDYGRSLEWDSMDFEEKNMRWIGTTETCAACDLQADLLRCSRRSVDMEIEEFFLQVEDRCFDFLSLSNSSSAETVQDWNLGCADDESMVMNSSYFFKNVKLIESYVGALVFDLEHYSTILQTVMEIDGMAPFVVMILFVLAGVEMMYRFQKGPKKLKKRFEEPKGHLSRARRWNGHLRSHFEFRMKLRSVLFLTLWTTGQAMDGDQLQRMFTHMMQLTEATVAAARSSAAVAEKLDRKDHTKGFGEASKVLRAPEAFEVDDPLRFVSWSDNFKNWLTYGDHRYVDLLKQVEELDEPCTLAEFASEEVVELGHRLYAILASYVKGPAAQFVKAAASERNGFRVWQQLRNLYCQQY